MIKRFRRGGVHPPENKLSRGTAIEQLPLPERVVIPLSQHIGAPADAVVEVGDRVVTGQLIGRNRGFVSANVHSSVSGVVESIGDVADGVGRSVKSVTIKVKGDEWAQEVDLSDNLEVEFDYSPEEIVGKVAEAGIVGLGGATFPTDVKLTIPHDCMAEFLIINGAECEPFLTADHRVMLEYGAQLIVGAKILGHALGVRHIYIGIENNKSDAIDHLRELTRGEASIEIAALRTRYPQGGEKQLIEAITGKRVPSGRLPIDVGVVVQNVGTALAVYEAVQKGKPLIERMVTVTGAGIDSPKNLKVRIGTPMSQLIEYCGELSGGYDKIIAGGPMMGRAVSNPGAPSTKGLSGLVLMYCDENDESVCISCAKCMRVCPMGLAPYLLKRLAENRNFERLESEHVTDCIECGSCVYDCPARIRLLDHIRVGKGEVIRAIRNRREG